MSHQKTLFAVAFSVCVSVSVLFADGRPKPSKKNAVHAKTDAERIAELEKRVQELEKRLEQLEQSRHLMVVPTPQVQPVPNRIPQYKVLPKSPTDGAIIIQPPESLKGMPPGTKQGTINGMTYYMMPIEKK